MQEVAVHETFVAGPSAPNVTAVAPFRPVPVIVTEVPAASGPELGLIPVTIGVGALTVVVESK